MMKPGMSDELVMSSEIICYLVKRFLLKTDAVIPFATQLKDFISSKQLFCPILCSEGE